MIETHELTKRFKSKKDVVTAVDGIELTVAPGELVALLGPNGAGKSTTLRMLTTLIPPTSGTARVAGFDVVRRQREVRQRIGYIGQGNGAGHSQRGRDELVSQGRAYGLRGGGCQRVSGRGGGGRRHGAPPPRRPASPAGHRDGSDPRARAALPRRAVN